MDTSDTTSSGIDVTLGVGAAVIAGAVGYCAWLGSSKSTSFLGAVIRRGLAPSWTDADPPADDVTLKAYLLQGLQLVGNRRGHMDFAHALRQLSARDQISVLATFVYPKLHDDMTRAWWSSFPGVASDADYADLVNSAYFCWPNPDEPRKSRFKQVVQEFWPDFTASVRALLEL